MKAVWEGVTSPPPQSEALTLPVWDLIDPIDEEERLISARSFDQTAVIIVQTNWRIRGI